MNNSMTKFEEKYITGQSGAKYYAYRLALDVQKEFIKDYDLLKFYLKIKSYQK